jgi:transposase
VLAYRSEYLVERSLGRLKGRPLSLTPVYVQRDVILLTECHIKKLYL